MSSTEEVRTVYQLATTGVATFVQDAKAAATAIGEIGAASAATNAELAAGAGASTADIAAFSKFMAQGAAQVAATKAGAAEAVAQTRAAGLASLETGRLGGVLGIGEAGKTLAGIGATFEVFSQIKAGIKYASDSAKVQAQVAAAIKSTGGAAHVTSKQVEELSNKLSFLSGTQKVDDVKQAEKVLLGFGRGIANEPGKGNNIFDQASLAVQNVAAHFGTRPADVALQLGKALTEPAKNLTLLRREGVLFSNQQIDQIKIMVASGNTLGAQKIILAQLTTQYGGAAKAAGNTFAGAMGRLDQAWENARNKLVVQLLPGLTRFTNWLAKEIPTATTVATKALSIFARDNSNVLSNWLKKQPGGKALSATYDYLNKQGAVADINDLDNKLGGRLPNFGTSGLDVLRDHSAPVAGFVGNRGASPFAATASGSMAKVNWTPNLGDAMRPVYLIADHKVLAQVVSKGMAQNAQASGRGTAHR